VSYTPWRQSCRLFSLTKSLNEPTQKWHELSCCPPFITSHRLQLSPEQIALNNLNSYITNQTKISTFSDSPQFLTQIPTVRRSNNETTHRLSYLGACQAPIQPTKGAQRIFWRANFITKFKMCLKVSDVHPWVEPPRQTAVKILFRYG